MAGNSNFVLRWEINNATAACTTGKVVSSVFNEGGFKWIAKVVKNNTLAKFTLSCGVDHNRPWNCEANVTMRVLEDYVDYLTYKKDLFNFNEDDIVWHQTELVSWHILTNPRYNHFGKVTVEFVIEIINGDRGETIPAKFSTPNSKSDVILKIGEHKLHVSKELLSIHSPVFDTMFFGSFVENGKQEVEIKDVDLQEFIDLLNVVYLETMEITDRTVLHILTLADRFQMKRIMEHAVKHLSQSKGIKAVQKLSVADQYGLTVLRDHCLNSYTSAGEVTEGVMSSRKAAEFSDEMKLAIYDRMVKLQAK